jgi:hypothetical protein
MVRRCALLHARLQKRPSFDRPARAAPLGFRVTKGAPHPKHVRERRCSAFRRRPASPLRLARICPQSTSHAWRFAETAKNGSLQTTQTFGIVFARGRRG